jgi:uncharacterized protein (TIGR02594 family)
MNPRWFDIAGSYLGTKEVVGKGSNPVIMGWAAKFGGWIASYFTDDDIPWCALFVNAVLKQSGIKGTGSLAARSFEAWGIKLTKPALGAILVFGRKGGGHVGFYVAENATAFLVRGGNQGNAVTDTWIDKSRLLAIRWPIGEPAPTSGPIKIDGTGAVSQDEA